MRRRLIDECASCRRRFFIDFMAAAGPDLRRGFAGEAPVSNADIGLTIAHILRLDLPAKGRLVGRVIDEAIGGPIPKGETRAVQSQPAANGLCTILNLQQVGSTRYFDAAGFPGRTVGLNADVASQ
jgi:hypothetical protein